MASEAESKGGDLPRNVTDAKTFLQGQTDAGGKYSLHDHITEVLLKLVTEQPEQSLELFEHLSAQVKLAKTKPAEPNEATAAAAQAGEAALDGWTSTCAALFEAAGSAASTPEALQDLHTDFDALKWAGAGYGDGENFRIQMAMRGLADKLANDGGDLTQIRFWGKIMGTAGEYFVCQGTYTGGDAELPEESANYEMGSEGPNQYSYWVTSALGADWTRLPSVSAAELVAARQIRRLFTGDLEAPLYGHPPFPAPAKEKNYLRATIALITSECSVVPTGMMTSEDGVLAADPEWLGAAEAAALGASNGSGWKLYVSAISPSGRCSEVPKNDEEEAAPPLQLRDLPAGAFKVWSPCSKKVALRSLVWEGAAGVGWGKHCAWTYSGYGMPTVSGKQYTPTPPTAPRTECSDDDLKVQADVMEKPAGEGEEEE